MTDPAMLPDLATRRAMLESSLDNFLRQAFLADIQVEALLAQYVPANQEAERTAQISEYQLTASNARAAAGRMQAMLAELPPA